MSEDVPSRSVSTIVFWGGILLLFTVLVAAAAYSFHEHRVAEQLAAHNSEVAASLNATRSQIDALTAKLSEMSTAQAETPAPSHADNHHSPSYQGPVSRLTKRRRVPDDPRWKKIEGQLDDQAKQIDSTRQDLTNTRTELQGSIATTHDELVTLEKKGERSYYEFDLDKSLQFQREGPVGVRLHKANTKHEYADLEMLVDDFKVSKKHVNIYEPVVFYAGDRKMPVELVINNISKNHIHGYVSEPKYKAAELEAMANSSANNTAASTNGLQATPLAKPSPVRQRLEHANMN
jgi:hypothetical protein